MIAVHKNRRGRYENAKTGKFFPLHPEKYKGTQLPIFKSSLELKMMRYLDSTPAIVAWNYEPMCIRYFDKTSNKSRRYFIDFVATVKQGMILKTIWIEIKPEKLTHAPKDKTNIQEMKSWIVNSCKWEAASKLASSKGYEFHIITEKQLNTSK